MNICILKESRKNEFRVPLVPKDIEELIKNNSKLKFFIFSKNNITISIYPISLLMLFKF